MKVNQANIEFFQSALQKIKEAKLPIGRPTLRQFRGAPITSPSLLETSSAVTNTLRKRMAAAPSIQAGKLNSMLKVNKELAMALPHQEYG